MKKELSFTEENYIKALFHLSHGTSESVNTNALAESMQTTPASVNDMVKRLSQKKLVSYQKYKGATLLPAGEKIALSVIRKHRLWEVFLVEKLDFKWDEVHEIAEQLEHIQSPTLIQKLDDFLGRPRVDPHGDPIPDENGHMKKLSRASVVDSDTGARGVVVAVDNDDAMLLQHLDRIGVRIGSKISIIEKMDFDGSVSVSIDSSKAQFISKEVASNIMLTLTE